MTILYFDKKIAYLINDFGTSTQYFKFEIKFSFIYDLLVK